uniref:Uncharacterized protein n=1 Tax=Ananas comosus var. bracteatus TaxID=296719 RepID=A0A6V7P2W2_ANACO|nr:unnamed protein product [Ananas comosus var. bracteatus]
MEEWKFMLKRGGRLELERELEELSGEVRVSLTSCRGAVQACVRHRSIARRSGEGVILPFSTSRRIGSSYRDCSELLGAVGVDGGPLSPFWRQIVPRARDLLVVRSVGPGYLTLACESLIELDRDTLHTRLGSSHECHFGDGRCAFVLVSFVQSLRCRLLPPLRLIVARASRVRALPDEPELVKYQLQIPGVLLWRLVGSSGECRDKSESRWRQIDAKRTLCDARAAYSEEICKTADFSACCTGTTSVAVPVQPARLRAGCPRVGSCTGTGARVPVQGVGERYFNSYSTQEHRILTRLGLLDLELREESTKPLLVEFGEVGDSSISGLGYFQLIQQVVPQPREFRAARD